MQKQNHRTISTKTNLTKTNLIVDGLILAVFLVATAPHFTGMAIHEWLGIGLGAMIVGHLLLHWSWLVQTTRRIFTTAPRQARINYVLNILLFITITLVTFTGIMISESVLPLLGIQVAPNMLWRRLHALTADLSVLVVGLHIALHWGWITHSVSRYLVNPAANGLRALALPRRTQKEI